MTSWEVIVGDCRTVLGELPAGSVHTVVTSPPYFGLRDYGTGRWVGGDPDHAHAPVRGRPSDGVRWDGTLDGAGNRPRPLGAPHRGGRRKECECGATLEDDQVGLEESPDEFVAAIVDVFRHVRRVLRDDGTVWVNLGDTYCSSPQGNGGSTSGLTNPDRQDRLARESGQHRPNRRMRDWPGIKPKDLIGIPWMVAFALRADGWYLRSEVIWHKPNPMPESVEDRLTRAHEQIFLLSKSPRYYYDHAAIREPAQPVTFERLLQGRRDGPPPKVDASRRDARSDMAMAPHEAGRNKRDVWTVTTKPYHGAHFATFPPELIEPCVLAGAPEGGVVLDPFAGAGTTGIVAVRNKRRFVGVELSEGHAQLARDRIATDVRLGHRPPTRVSPVEGQESLL